MLVLAGCGAGGVIAVQAIAVASAWAPASIPRLDEVTAVGVDRAIVSFVVAIGVLVTALLTIAPLGVLARGRSSAAGGSAGSGSGASGSASASARDSAGDILRSASRGAIGGGGGDRWNRRVRNVMVVAEIAAALVLLLTTSVLLDHLFRLRAVDPGFRADGVFQARVSMPPSYRSSDDVSRFYERLLEGLRTAPGVEQVGVISIAPLSGLIAAVPFSVEGQSQAARDRVMANLRVISPDFLSTVGTRVIEGRGFSETDRSDTSRVVLVSASLADRFFAGADASAPARSAAIGRRLFISDNNSGPRPVEIVGVVEHVRHIALDQPPGFDIYLPLRQVHPDNVLTLANSQFWMIKLATAGRAGATGAGGDPATFRATFISHLRAIDADAAVSGTTSMSAFVDTWLEARRFNLGLFAAFALTAVFLAALGLYGLVSYTVTQRTPEIGLRLALGATPRDVLRLILRQALTLGLAGTIAGLAVAAIAQPLLSHMVHELHEARDVAIDPAVASAIATLLIAIVLLAAWLPARRASRIAPTLALKA